MLFKAFFNSCIYIFLPSAVFLAGYRLTEAWFRQKLVPFPFERYGVAVGSAGFFWTLALVLLVTSCQKRRRS